MAWSMTYCGENGTVPDVGDKVVEVETGEVFECVRTEDVETYLGDISYRFILVGSDGQERDEVDAEFCGEDATFTVIDSLGNPAEGNTEGAKSPEEK